MIAIHVLHRLQQDDAWASLALDAELRRAGVDRADVGLVTQIVYGTLRVLPSVDQRIEQHARRPSRIDPWVRAALRTAAFQLLYLRGVPPHATVHETVRIVRDKRGPKVAGFVNAVLRKIAAARPAQPKLPDRVDVPPWLDAALWRALGEHATALLRLPEGQPSIDLRVRAHLAREAVADAIERRHPGHRPEPTRISPHGLRVRGIGDPRELPGYREGRFAAQEEGAQLIGLLVDAQPGDRVLDACAGRGGKTAQLVEAVGDRGTVMAADLHQHRLDQIPRELERLQLPVERVQRLCVDWTVGVAGLEGQFDRALVDAPCTGLGTLRRRPEILLRLRQTDAARMGEKQRAILENVARCVRPGGSLIYSVCSPMEEEGAEVVDHAFLPGLERTRDDPAALESLRFGPTGEMQLGPGRPGSDPWADGYQVYRWVHVGHCVDRPPPQR